MALQTLSTIKDWFKTGLKPSQTQFWDTWDSFRHKNDKVPVKEVEGLDEILDQLPPKTIYESGQLLVFKNPGNESGNNFLEPDDTVIGFVEGDFLNAGTYYGGDPMLLSSYEEPKEASFYVEVEIPEEADYIFRLYGFDGSQQIDLGTTESSTQFSQIPSELLGSLTYSLEGGLNAVIDVTVYHLIEGNWISQYSFTEYGPTSFANGLSVNTPPIPIKLGFGYILV